MLCTYCGSDDVEYIGIDDGGGDYGDSLVELWECYSCGITFETEIVTVGIDVGADDEIP